MRLRAILPPVLVLLAMSAPAVGGGMVEFHVDGEKIQGKVLAVDCRHCRLMRRDGRIEHWELGKIKHLKKVSTRFEPFSCMEMRNQLRVELGDEYEVAATRRYVVGARQGDAGRYAQLFEQIYSSIDRYFTVRGFRISDPEVPLIAIVFPDRARFAAYCRKEKASSENVLGYYFHWSNRVVLFDTQEHVSAFPDSRPVALLSCYPQFGTAGASRLKGEENCLLKRSSRLPARIPGYGSEDSLALAMWGGHASIQGDLRETIIHETVHQAAYNCGLHARLGDTPTWICEGLATAFEADGIRDSVRGQSVRSRLNLGRFFCFKDFVKKRRKPQSLSDFIADDAMFQKSPSDAYAQAWALTYYLIDTRAADYARYLKAIAERDPLETYGPTERVDDFKKAFTRDLDILEASFMRYLDKIELK